MLALLALALVSGSAFAETKIAVVSLGKIFDSYWKTKQADAALKDRQAELKKSESELEASYKKATEEYQKLQVAASDQAVTADERDKRKKEAEAKLKDIKQIETDAQQFQRQAGTILQEEKNRKTKNLVDEIKLAITGQAKTGNYTLVVDADSVLFTNGENDITESVITLLNAGAPPEVIKAEAKPEVKPDTSKAPKK